MSTFLSRCVSGLLLLASGVVLAQPASPTDDKAPPAAETAAAAESVEGAEGAEGAAETAAADSGDSTAAPATAKSTKAAEPPAAKKAAVDGKAAAPAAGKPANPAPAARQPQLVASGEFDDRWYLGGFGGAVFAGKDDVDSGGLGSLTVGRSLTDWLGFELEASFSNLDVGSLPPSSSEYERTTLGTNLIAYLADEKSSARPYLLGNVNLHQIDFLEEDLSGFGAGAGGGVFFALSKRVDLRLEARYNLDFINAEGVVPDDTFYVWTGGVGARYKFGSDPYDDDGDGVPNALDKCPDTPKGVKVYSDGCPIDSDQDGVPDYLDQCPNTPPGTVVNAEGCPADADGDGVLDQYDQCPGTPPGVKVGPNGCPLDSDGDGVPDYLDQCPDTPRGQAVNSVGCPITDADGDGVPDHLDKCPDSPPGQKVGPDGCPLDSDGDGIPDDEDQCPNTPPGLKVLPDGCAPVGDCRKPRPGEPVDARGCALDKRFVLKGVKFEFDSDRLTPAAQLILNDVADTLAAYPALKVDVEGHTDSLGSDAYNLGLSERRAIAVKRYLANRGVKETVMRPVGYGEANPIDSNDSEEGRENNRRVEFKVTEG